MDTNTILLIINLVISFLTPIIMAIIQIAKRVKKSKCMGSESILSPDNSLHLEKRDESTKEANIKDIEEIIKRLSTNQDRNKNISL